MEGSILEHSWTKRDSQGSEEIYQRSRLEGPIYICQFNIGIFRDYSPDSEPHDYHTFHYLIDSSELEIISQDLLNYQDPWLITDIISRLALSEGYDYSISSVKLFPTAHNQVAERGDQIDQSSQALIKSGLIKIACGLLADVGLNAASGGVTLTPGIDWAEDIAWDNLLAYFTSKGLNYVEKRPLRTWSYLIANLTNIPFVPFNVGLREFVSPIIIDGGIDLLVGLFKKRLK